MALIAGINAVSVGVSYVMGFTSFLFEFTYMAKLVDAQSYAFFRRKTGANFRLYARTERSVEPRDS